jgi:hypothetical protein
MLFMRTPHRQSGGEVLRSVRSARMYTMPRHALLNFKKAALVCTIAHGAASGGATLRVAAGSQPTYTGPSFARCKLHQIACCPVCHKQEYVAQRVAKAVLSGLKRLGLRKTQSVLEYLGVKTWHEVCLRAPATALPSRPAIAACNRGLQSQPAIAACNRRSLTRAAGVRSL